jgi:hypothetical protein
MPANVLGAVSACFGTEGFRIDMGLTIACDVLTVRSGGAIYSLCLGGEISTSRCSFKQVALVFFKSTGSLLSTDFLTEPERVLI